MELKVWCDGIQRIVCGVQPTTTCQDIVQILAYTTGKTGRFILIEKWKNNERILAPNDHPIVSLSKWGEFSNDVCYVLKRTGDLPSNYGGQQPKTAANNHHLNTPKFSGKKSEISELKRKQQHHRISNIENSLKNNDGNHSNMKHSTSAPQHLFRNMVNEDHSNNQNASQQQNLDYLSLTRDTRNTNHHSYHPGRPSKVNNQPAESLYGTLNKPMIRPRKPPPYQEAIAKSSLINKDGIITFQASQNNYIETIPNTATSQTTKQSIPISLVSIQSRQQPPPPQSSNHNDNEFDMIDDEQQLEQELQQLLMDGQQYTNEMKEIKMKLMQNEHEVDRCRNEIERLMAKIDNQLNNCKNESHNPNDDAIDFDSSNSNDYRSIIEKLKSSIQETNDKINVQQTDLQVMDESLEHYDENMRNKQELIENLIEQIKEANVEGMELQELIDLSANNSKQINDIVWNDEDGQQQSSTILIDSNDKSNLNSLKNQMTIKTNSSSSSSAITNRRIPVSLLELGNTVPTKRNPDGIWV